MRSASFNHHCLMAACAVVVMTMTQSVGSARVGSSTLLPIVADPDLASELRTLDSFANDLTAFNERCAQLSKKASVLGAEIDPLQRRSEDLKRRVSDVQNAAREVVRKLKAANKWDDLDAKILAAVNDPRLRTALQEESFKQLLEGAAANLNSHAKDLSIPVDNLRKKVTSRTASPYGALIVPAEYRGPALMKFVSVACTVDKIRVGLIFRLGGTPTVKQTRELYCECEYIDCSASVR